MSEDIQISTGSKIEQYKSLIPQIQGLVTGEPDLIANLANLCAALKMQFDWLWVGVYLVKGDQLVLGPFQGPVACTRISYNKGVCGTAWARAETIVVPDVDLFPGHIACSSLSRSEIVVPIKSNDKVIGVLDIDSVDFNSFDETDKVYLEQMTGLVIQ